MNDISRSFGFQTVAKHERERHIRRVFQAVAPRGVACIHSTTK